MRGALRAIARGELAAALRLAGVPTEEAESAAEGAARLDTLARDARLAVLLVFHEGDEANMRPFLAHPRSMVGSDGIYFPDGVIHPRVTSTAPRVLGRAVRDWKLFSLEEAVYKLSGFAARRFVARSPPHTASARRTASSVITRPRWPRRSATFM